jgi:hypothetical protein
MSTPLPGTKRDKHVLEETSYCSTMYEQPPINGRSRCTAAGRYMDTEGRVICARCAAGLVVVKLTDIPKLIALSGQIASSRDPLTDDQRAQLRVLVAPVSKDAT